MEIAGNQLKPESIDIQSRPKALLRVRCRWKSNGIKRFACGPRYVVRKENSNSNSIPVLSFRPPTPYKSTKYCGISNSSTLYTTPWHEFFTRLQLFNPQDSMIVLLLPILGIVGGWCISRLKILCSLICDIVKYTRIC